MQRIWHRAGVGVIAWRQAGAATTTATLAPRDNHRRMVGRGTTRPVVGFTASGTVISATPGSAAANGVDAALVTATTILCSVGDATASGITASVVNGSASINTTAGNAAAAGATASISNGLAVYPDPSTVLVGVSYGPTGVEYTGTFAVPSAASIAAQVRTELAAELLRITEVAKIHGLVQGVNLVVTPTSRTAGDIAQTISGDGVSSSTVSRA